MIARRKLHRAVFVAAGIYNIGWGLFAALDPQWLFRFAGIPLQNYPQIFACLGMVIGLYGLLYLEVARALGERAAVGGGGDHVSGGRRSGSTCTMPGPRFDGRSRE